MKELNMEKIYEGKTKTVYKLEDGNILLAFKDDVTGEDGKFDPGANSVGLSIEGVGNANLQMSSYFFKLIEQKGYGTHYVSTDYGNNSMTVKPVQIFGKGIEVICRFMATGSFIRRYGSYIEEHTPLDSFVEITLKDDLNNDPTINEDALIMLSILTKQEYETLISMTKGISNVIKDDLTSKGMMLYDIKLEFGRDMDNNIVLIDEVSSGNMRVYFQGKTLEPFELSKKVLR